jgi:hypothetical protein
MTRDDVSRRGEKHRGIRFSVSDKMTNADWVIAENHSYGEGFP